MGQATAVHDSPPKWQVIELIDASPLPHSVKHFLRAGLLPALDWSTYSSGPLKQEWRDRLEVRRIADRCGYSPRHVRRLAATARRWGAIAQTFHGYGVSDFAIKLDRLQGLKDKVEALREYAVEQWRDRLDQGRRAELVWRDNVAPATAAAFASFGEDHELRNSLGITAARVSRLHAALSDDELATWDEDWKAVAKALSDGCKGPAMQWQLGHRGRKSTHEGIPRQLRRVERWRALVIEARHHVAGDEGGGMARCGCQAQQRLPVDPWHPAQPDGVEVEAIGKRRPEDWLGTWPATLRRLDQIVGREDSAIWLRGGGLRPVAVDKGALVLQVDTVHHAAWVARHYLEDLVRVLGVPVALTTPS